MGIFDVFKKKQKSNKKWYVFYMLLKPNEGKLQEVIDSLNEGEAYLQEVVRSNFVYALHKEEYKIYGKNMKGFFPDEWPAPIYKGNNDVIRQCVIDYLKEKMPGINTDIIDIRVQIHSDGEFASASFEYGVE